MLIFPIVNKDRIVNVQVQLKTATKVAKNISDLNIGPSDIIVNSHKFSESVYSNSVSTVENVVEFIKSSLKSGKSNVLVSTKKDQNTGLYDIYEVIYPENIETPGLEQLVGTLILDLKNESSNAKSRYLDFTKLKTLNNITDEKLSKLNYASSNMRYMDVNKYINENNLKELFKILPFFDNIDFTIIKGSIIPLREFKSTLEFLEPTRSKDYNNLAHLYEIAQNNQREYSKLSYLNKILNNNSLSLIHSSKEKVKVYADEHQDEAA